MKCIYCMRDSGVTFRGVEHVIPQAFGRFGSNTPTVNCVCDDCNSYFGRELDRLLARDTIEGVSRYARGQLSSESRAQKRLEISLAEGPEAGPFAGLRVSVDGATGKLMRPRAQFHAFNFQTQKNEVYFIEQIPGLALPEANYAGLSEIDMDRSQAEMRFWVGCSVERKSNSIEWSAAIVDFALTRLNLNRVYALQLARHPRSARILTSIGMQREGFVRKRIYKDGLSEDVVCWAIVRNDS